MGILTPDPGLVFWTSLSFLTLLLLLRRYAWKPMLRALKVREEYIAFSLQDAHDAREEVRGLENTRKKMMEAARLEREKIIREARELRKEIVAEAKKVAEAEAIRVLAAGREQLERERRETMAALRQEVGLVSLEIAGKILHDELKNDARQQAVIAQYMKEMDLN